MKIKRPDSYEPCTHPGCDRGVNNRAGLCSEHRTRKCEVSGCTTTFIQVKSQKRCKKHAHYERKRVPALSDDWMNE